MLAIKNAGITDIPVIKELADTIWQITYKDILAPEQLAYMLDYFYSQPSLTRQMNDGQQFILLSLNKEQIGFASYSLINTNPVTYKLHKLYVHPSQQGKGSGKFLLDNIINIIKQQGAGILELNVNRYNKALHFYQKIGFVIIKEEDVDIGNGYYQNDYVMQKNL